MTKNKKRWVAYDVETERLHYEVRGGWENPAGFGFTVGSAVDNEGNEKIFKAVMDEGFAEGAMRALIKHLLTYDRIVSFNGIKFDNVVIAAGDDMVLAALNEKSWDIKALLDHELGIDDKYGPHIVSLAGVGGATVGAVKTLSDGRDAVRLWRKGDYKTVTEYNLQDSRITAQVYEFGERNGYVLFEPARVPLVIPVRVDNPENGKPYLLRGGLIVVKVKASWRNTNSS